MTPSRFVFQTAARRHIHRTSRVLLKIDSSPITPPFGARTSPNPVTFRENLLSATRTTACHAYQASKKQSNHPKRQQQATDRLRMIHHEMITCSLRKRRRTHSSSLAQSLSTDKKKQAEKRQQGTDRLTMKHQDTKICSLRKHRYTNGNPDDDGGSGTTGQTR